MSLPTFFKQNLNCQQPLLNAEKEISLHIDQKYDFLKAIKIAQAPFFSVLKNLVENGLKHNPSSTKEVVVEVKGSCDQHYIEVSVKDNGPGIPVKYHKKIFQLFQTLKPQDESGSGLGLAIVKKTVEHEEGEISVTSNEGQGAVFTFTWPISAQR